MNILKKIIGKITDKIFMLAETIIIGLLKSKDKDYRSLGAELSGIIGKSAVDKLIVNLKDRDIGVRMATANVLGLIGDPRAVEPLIKAMNIHPSVTINAAKSLGLIGDKRATGALINILTDRDRQVREEAENALNRIDPSWLVGNKVRERIPDYIEHLNRGNLAVREAVKPVLTKILISGERNGETRKFIHDVIFLLKNKHWDVREYAAGILCQYQDLRAVGPLVDALKDKELKVRVAAAESLGEIRDIRAVGALVWVVENDRGRAKDAAELALTKIIPSHDHLVNGFPYIVCAECHRRPMRMESRKKIAPGKVLVFCPSCHKTESLLTGIAKVVGVIGGEIRAWESGMETMESRLWVEDEKRARYADIDVLVIRNGGVQNYHRAINAVILEFSGNPSGQKRLKEIPFHIEGDPDLSDGVRRMLEDNMGPMIDVLTVCSK